jgi:hypothetical protein
VLANGAGPPAAPNGPPAPYQEAPDACSQSRLTTVPAGAISPIDAPSSRHRPKLADADHDH